MSFPGDGDEVVGPARDGWTVETEAVESGSRAKAAVIDDFDFLGWLAHAGAEGFEDRLLGSPDAEEFGGAGCGLLGESVDLPGVAEVFFAAEQGVGAGDGFDIDADRSAFRDDEDGERFTVAEIEMQRVSGEVGLAVLAGEPLQTGRVGIEVRGEDAAGGGAEFQPAVAVGGKDETVRLGQFILAYQQARRVHFPAGRVDQVEGDRRARVGHFGGDFVFSAGG